MFICCYACHEDKSTLLLKHATTPNTEYSTLDIALTPYRGFRFKTSNFNSRSQRAVTGGEYILFHHCIDAAFPSGSIYSYWLETFYGDVPSIAIDESISDGSGAYYDATENTIYFNPNSINIFNFRHEYIHSIQRAFGYPMRRDNGDVRNIEYEVFVVMDIIQCFEKGRILNSFDDLIYGLPQGKQNEYTRFIY